MSFWNRKKTEVEEPKAPVILDSANWHEWEAGAKKAMENGDLANSIEFYKQAVDRFEGSERDFERFVSRVAADIVTYTKFISVKGRAVPVHLFAEIDNEIHIKMPGSEYKRTVCDAVIDGLDPAIDAATGPGEITMLGLTAACAMLGYLRFSCDMREDLMRAARASELCYGAAERAQGLVRVNGQLRPMEAAACLNIYADFCESLKGCIAVIVNDMSDDELDRLAEYRIEHPIDMGDKLVEGLDSASHTILAKKKDKQRNRDKWLDDVRLFAEEKSSMD
jgi:hypothetical protein